MPSFLNQTPQIEMQKAGMVRILTFLPAFTCCPRISFIVSRMSRMLGARLGITDKMEAWPQLPLLIPQAPTRMKGLALVILTCFFLSSVELAGKNVKVLIVLERSMRKHKAFCSCAQKIIYKVTTDICSRIFTKNVPG